MVKKAVKVFTLSLSSHQWSFCVRFAMLLLGVVAGFVLLHLTGHHEETQKLLGVYGLAKGFEVAGEAAADALVD